MSCASIPSWRSQKAVAVSLLALFMFAASAFAQQKLYPVKTDVVGCREKALREKLTTIRDSGDRQAFNNLGTAAIATGACRELTAGSSVYLEEGSMFGYVCLRPYGETGCYWTFPQAIR